MTKRRPPLSTEAALARIAGQMPGGYEEMAAIVDRSAGHIRNWGNPDREEDVPFTCARQLDIAFRAAGGEGFPLFESYAAQLELADAERFACRHRLLAETQGVIKEGGEAHEALVRLCLPGATEADRAAAQREVAEALEKLKLVFPLLDAMPGDPAASSPEPKNRAPP